MRIGVTGGSGGVGQFVCDELVREGHEVTSLDVNPPGPGVKHTAVDLTLLQDTCEAAQGFNQIIHLAAILGTAGSHGPDEKISLNTKISFNVFEAAKQVGIPRVIYGCSDCITGLGIKEVKLTPQYVPIDEEHDLWPHETYSLAKYIGERIGANYAKAFGIEVISLRYPAVMLQRVADYFGGIMGHARPGEDLPEILTKDQLGANIAARDVARAFAAAVRYQFASGNEASFEPFFVTARNTLFSSPTLEFLEALFGTCPTVKDRAYFENNPHASVYDCRKAQCELGWKPQLDWQDFEQWEK